MQMLTFLSLSIWNRRPAPIIGAQLLAISAKDTRPDLHRIPSTLPVLIIHGNRDRMVAYSESEVSCLLLWREDLREEQDNRS